MHEINAAGVDLNLLPALLHLLEERSVTRAARRSGRTQSAMSHTLARLRALLDDPILVTGPARSFTLTARAEAMLEPLRRILGDANRLVQQPVVFDPTTEGRTFTLACPDLLAPILPVLASRLAREAPRASLEVRALDGRGADGLLEQGLADLVLAPFPTSSPPGIVVRRLSSLSWVVVMRAGHPLSRKRALKLADWTAYPHIAIRMGTSSRSMVAEAITAAGAQRQVSLVVPTFLSALVAVASCDALLSAPKELVAPLAKRLAVVLAAPPVPIPSVPVAALWHERQQADPAQRWFRSALIEETTTALRKRAPQGEKF